MPQNSFKFRTKILKYVALSLFAVILVRLFFIQIIEHADYLEKADEQHILQTTIAARRGEIYMMDKGEPVPVVLNQTRYFIAIDPTVTKKENAKKVLEEYAGDYKVNDLEKIYDTEGLRYAVIARDMPLEVAEKIIEADFSGIWVKKSNYRFYPEGNLASGLLGFVNSEGEGQYGVEGSLDELLRGKDGELKTITDINKVALSIGNENFKKPAEDGKSVVLSVDRGLEKGIEELTATAINDTTATNAAVLVMDPNTGKVLAMASLPNYNPGKYFEVEDASRYLNYTTEVPYEPASVCKTFTYAAAINEGVMSPESTYFNKHVEYIDDLPKNNASKYDHLYGTTDMKKAFYWSLNTGSIHALKLLGGDTSTINQQGREKLFDYYYNKFRLGQFTGIEINESDGIVQDPNEGWGRNSVYADMTFGQNLNITMLQTLSAFSAVINGGIYRTPSIIEGVLEDGEIVSIDREDTIEEEVISSETSATMRELLINNRSTPRSTGADRPGYAIGGKTGTGEVSRNGIYVENETTGSYVGFVGPNGELPKYAIMVKMWGEGQELGGGEAMSLFTAISNYLIDYFKIKPRE
ncbi:penicillin-binding protein 2 [Candidatus Saccharibacteria bacterium]|nr:penicillin-binding protein 2 [Candidatus Saccharibacteria bacterium]